MNLTWMLVVGVGLLLTYEIIAAVRNAPTYDPLTISQLIWRGSTKTPFIPFMFGVLMGHLFAR